ncbi:chromate transporter [Edaphobacter modestus]|uniref:Chromate transporter n=1 Tax=Edaphobacter modestus TaxID=388466 RepID=A0A4Q7YVT9_9BACT|nr:chromate transporter [Edaphobacter modestus]
MNRSLQPAIEQKAPFGDFLLYFLRLGTLGFGGPIALASRIQSELVEDRGWIEWEDYLEGLSFAQLAPRPLAAQFAMYLGYVREVCWAQLRWVWPSSRRPFSCPNLSSLLVLGIAGLFLFSSIGGK